MGQSVSIKMSCMFGVQKKGIRAIRYVPERINLFKNDNIVSVGLGDSFIGILKETQEESKETEVVLESGEEITVQNGINFVENKRLFNVYIQNQALFQDEWIKIETKAQYLKD